MRQQIKGTSRPNVRMIDSAWIGLNELQIIEKSDV